MPRPRNTSERLLSLVAKNGPNDCWPWMGWRNEQGYGRFERDGKSYYAHRAIYLLANPGSISLNAPKSTSESGFMRHTCDNPPCCNPAHLVLGTHAENMHDSVVRGRRPDFRGHRGPRAKLSEDDVRWIRFLYHSDRANMKALALLYEVSSGTIQSAIYGRHYKDVL